jgi:hypothetical protein
MFGPYFLDAPSLEDIFGAREEEEWDEEEDDDDDGTYVCTVLYGAYKERQ